MLDWEAELQPRDVINIIFPDFLAKEPEIDHAVIGLAEGQSFNRRPCTRPLQVRE